MPTPPLKPKQKPISVCFMVMPFGKKPTQAGTDTIPAEVDFDLLWDKVFRPMIVEDLKLVPIRADQDAGALIIQAMIERLVISDVVIADLTLPNANVYYEVGLRHAAQRQGCVLVAADWSKPLFDVSQMKRVKYPLKKGPLSDKTAAAIRKKLADTVKASMNDVCPVFQTVPGYPTKIKKEQLASFHEVAGELAEFQAKVSVARGLSSDQAASMASELVEQYKGYALGAPSMALDLVHLFRDKTKWSEGLDFIDGLPAPIRELPAIREQRALMLGKLGKPLQAIVELEALIRSEGDSSERSGLLGGRYKALYDSEFEQKAQSDFLNKAIHCYERAMFLDLNDYYPSGNLPRLYRSRKAPGDEVKAGNAAVVARLGCERTRKQSPSDVWAPLTMLGAAFDAGDVAAADGLLAEMKDAALAPFYIRSTLPDLRRSLLQNDDANTSAKLAAVLGGLQSLQDANGTVAATAGRRIDAPGAEERRFPAGNERVVAQRIHNILVGSGCRAVVSSAACGADILVLEIAQQLGLRRRVVLPFTRDEFRATSVADRGEEWGQRFDAILDHLPAADILQMNLAKGDDQAYATVNAKILDEATTWGAEMQRPLLAMVVWNGFTRGATDLTDGFRKLALERKIDTISIPTL